jgi:O-antigen/teichoic acid export membrane protein
MVLLLGFGLVILTIALNIVFIPKYGVIGAAYATFIAVIIYNIAKILFVNFLFKIIPFTISTLKTLVLIILCFVIFYFWNFPFNPVVNIVLKSILISGFYGFIAHHLRLSEDVSMLIKKILRL